MPVRCDEMSQIPPPASRKPSTPWDRLRPVRQDPLESMGYVSKGDNRLLDLKAQENFYNKIVARYMQFCSQHSKDLDSAFASLSLNTEGTPDTNSPVETVDNPLPPNDKRSVTSLPPKSPSLAQDATSAAASIPASELSTILTALRKLREGLLASSSNAPSPVFAQRVHVFNIRLAILARHPESYHPSLQYLLSVLHTEEYSLPRSELMEMTTYLILDAATRQDDLGRALALRYGSRVKFGFGSRIVDATLRSIITQDWVSFWRIRRKVDGYVRAILHWYLARLRKTVLKAIGRTYMVCDIQYILRSATDEEMDWDELVAAEDVGWIRDGEKAIIRKPKPKGHDQAKQTLRHMSNITIGF